jgi:hypothetical protein
MCSYLRLLDLAFVVSHVCSQNVLQQRFLIPRSHFFQLVCQTAVAYYALKFCEMHTLQHALLFNLFAELVIALHIKTIVEAEMAQVVAQSS